MKRNVQSFQSTDEIDRAVDRLSLSLSGARSDVIRRLIKIALNLETINKIVFDGLWEANKGDPLRAVSYLRSNEEEKDNELE